MVDCKENYKFDVGVLGLKKETCIDWMWCVWPKRAPYSFLYVIYLIVYSFAAPIAPEIVPDECTVTNNAITLSWRPRIKQSCVDGYVVEIDDGTSSGKEDNFQEVYRGSCLECTVSGLQFNSTYRARVKGFNKAGEGAPSDEVYLTTSDGKKKIEIVTY